MKNLMKKNRTAYLFPIFILIFIASLSAQSIQCEWTGIEKIVAVGDIHGDYDNFESILIGTGLIDENLTWIGGKTYLVQTGDIIDKGPDAKKVFDLLMRLEKEAEAAGGKVHMLIGNHEEMNITGIAFDYAGYVTLEQFVSFLPDTYREKQEKKLMKKIGEQTSEEMNSDFSSSSYIRDYWKEVLRNERSKKDGSVRRLYINNFNEQYGKWILQHNAVIKINDIIFAHGGISKKYSTQKLEDINNLLREELNHFRIAIKRSLQPQTQYKIVYDSTGPLWYRGFALIDEEVFKPEVDTILKNLDAKYMVIAHTPQIWSPIVSKELMSRFQDRIWIIDTGISHSYSSILSALIIENGNFRVWGGIDEH